ncbi:MAG: dipeptide/oligopeptide/nickel ABC transporter ATP-binding protein, partial [Actinobacteria bacterium]|nr:dipeptide/oligopeptide/nickel ABC transporter ATP-binding protein [Actinomycetota bacterium]
MTEAQNQVVPGTEGVELPRDEPVLRIEGLVKHFPIKRGVLRRRQGVVRAVD